MKFEKKKKENFVLLYIFANISVLKKPKTFYFFIEIYFDLFNYFI